MTTEIRVLDSEGDLVAAANVFRTAMIGFPRLADLDPGQITRMLEPGRTIGAFADGQLVGTADAVTSSLTLPGGALVDHAAVTHIGVLPSFTRRGIATDLFAISCATSPRAVRRSRPFGRPKRPSTSDTATASPARPTASKSRPHGRRFVRAWLPAARCGCWILRTCGMSCRGSIPTTGRRVRERSTAQTCGGRASDFAPNPAPGPWYVAVHGAPGSENGFARYRPIDTDKWFVSDQRTIVVEDFFAPDVDSYLGLLRFLLGLDLIDRVVFWMLPVDDPLPWLLLDQRAATGDRHP